MLYFILSPKWTNNDRSKRKTYWMPNQNGYTTIIADAGVYTEDEVREITSHIGEEEAKAIPVTKKLLEKARKQQKQKETALNTEYHKECERHMENMKFLAREFEENAKRERIIEDLMGKITD